MATVFIWFLIAQGVVVALGFFVAPARRLQRKTATQSAERQTKAYQEKVARDLFDHRFSVYMDVWTIVSFGGNSKSLGVTSKCPAAEPNFDPNLPEDLLARSHFLFGEEIAADLKKLHEICVTAQNGEVETARCQSRELFDEMRPKFDPYMRLDSKL